MQNAIQTQCDWYLNTRIILLNGELLRIEVIPCFAGLLKLGGIDKSSDLAFALDELQGKAFGYVPANMAMHLRRVC